MLQNLDVSDTLIALGQFVKNDTAVDEFVSEHFSGDLKVVVGNVTRQIAPTVEDCPYIVFTNFRKKEGQNIDFCEYACDVWIGLTADNSVVDEDGIEMLEVYDTGSKFMHLIEDIFNDKTKRNRPLSRCETAGPYALDAKHWVGSMDLTWRIYQTMGPTYQEEL